MVPAGSSSSLLKWWCHLHYWLKCTQDSLNIENVISENLKNLLLRNN